jgi:hypothetical protein
MKSERTEDVIYNFHRVYTIIIIIFLSSIRSIDILESCLGSCRRVYLTKKVTNVVVEWLALLLRIREVTGSILGPGYPDLGFRGFL